MNKEGDNMCISQYRLLEIQHEYSTFVTIREINSLDYDEDWEYCMNILNRIPDIDIKSAQKELATLMCWNEENGWFDSGDWDYIMLDEILLNCVDDAIMFWFKRDNNITLIDFIAEKLLYFYAI